MPRLTVALSLLTALVGARAFAQRTDKLPTSGLAPSDARLSAEQVRAEIERLKTEIGDLRRSAAAPAEWKERMNIEAQLREISERHYHEQAPLRQKLDELLQLPAVRAWGDRVARHEARLRALEDADYQLTKEAGRRLFEARHAQLANAAPIQTPQLHELALDVLTFPRMDGSTSTQPLATLIACRCFAARYGWVGRDQALPKGPRGSRLPASEWDLFSERRLFESEPELKLLEFTLRAQATPPTSERLALIINGLLAANASTHQAYVNLIEGRSDIGLLARPPSTDERQLAHEKNVELDIAPCARDAFVFLVHQTNPVKNLTTAQIRDIYSGRARNWKSLGGPDGEITAYQREENSGSQELMRTLLMKEVPLYKPEIGLAPDLIGQLMSSTFLSLTNDDSGIGYSVYYYEQFMSGSPRTRTIAVDGVAPTYDSIRERKYPYVSDVLVVTRNDMDAESPAKRLREWLLSAEGQAIVKESGYVPVLSGRER